MKIDRIKTLQNLGIFALALISLHYMNMLFGSQIKLFFAAVNSILLPFGIALFISYLVAPLMKLLERRARIKKQWMKVVIVILALIAFIALLFFMIGDIVYTQAKLFFTSDWEAILLSVETYIQDNDFLKGIYDQLMAALEQSGNSTDFVSVVNVFRGVANVILTIVLVPVFLVFILHDRETVFRGILSTLPKTQKHHVEELGKRANDVVERYFNGKFLSMFIVGFIFTIVLWIFGFSLDKAIFFGFTLGFLDIIPYIGGFIGIALPVLYSFIIVDDVLFGQYTFIVLIAVNLVLQFLQGNVIQPLIMGREVNMHPLLVLVSFIFFGALFGITGVILAIPLTGTIKASIEYYNELKDKPQPKGAK